MAARPDETGDGGEAQEVVPVEDRKFAELIASFYFIRVSCLMSRKAPARNL